MVAVAADVSVDHAHCVAEFDRSRWSVGGDQQPEEMVVDPGVEDRHALAVGGSW